MVLSRGEGIVPIDKDRHMKMGAPFNCGIVSKKGYCINEVSIVLKAAVSMEPEIESEIAAGTGQATKLF
jgi:hypothetical protein